MLIQHKLTPFIWLQSGADAAVEHYLKVFRGNGKVTHTQRWGEGAPAPAGSVMAVSFELAGQPLVAFNGGPHLKLTEAFSLVVACEDQAEIDHLWEQLPAGGGAHSQCGWLKDAWGLAWQVVPKAFFEMIRDPDSTRTQRALQAVWSMQKLDLAAIQRAYDGN